MLWRSRRASVAGVVVHVAHASGHADGEAAPIFGIKIPPGYRDWRLISVAHEEGDLNDIRAFLGMLNVRRSRTSQPDQSGKTGSRSSRSSCSILNGFRSTGTRHRAFGSFSRASSGSAVMIAIF